MNSMQVIFFLALAAPAFGSWNSGQGGSWAPAPVPANIALSQDGKNVLDTPEVAQARAAHLAALSQAQANSGNSNDDGSYDSRWEAESQYRPDAYNNAPAQQWNSAPAQQWNGAPAQQWSGAPAQQWSGAPAQQWNAAPAQQWNAAPANQQAWHLQPANIALSRDGQHVLDTPEVAQARAAHLAAYNAAKAAGATASGPASAPAPSWNAAPAPSWNAAPATHSGPAPSWNAAPAPQPAAPSWNADSAAGQRWNGPPANIALSQNGQYVLDTPEVAQARAAHLASYSGVGAHAPAAPAAPAAPGHW